MDKPRFVVGIDLGTTNTALAYVDTAEERPEVVGFDIPQLTPEGDVRALPLLPSFGYVVSAHDGLDLEALLPWLEQPGYVTGAYARARGAEVPGRLVNAAKSWLCHGEVDRTDRHLPQEAPDDVARISPVDATARLLGHLRRAWNERIARGDPRLMLEHQEVFLTVPASFDTTARMLTLMAADEAGFPHLTLLEEPLAAFYAWLHRVGEGWRERVKLGERVLVCDIGGGTTDFTIVDAAEQDGELQLIRSGVGNHLLLGGDNMDLALARILTQKLRSQGVKLDRRRLLGLWQAARGAKEELFGDVSLKNAKVRVVGGGSQLVGGTTTTELTREELDGTFEAFLPPCELGTEVAVPPVAGLSEVGLPFEHDPAITRHLATFLRLRRTDKVDHVLFNGGVTKAPVVRERLLERLAGWFPGAAVQVLEGEAPDLAVARGAAYYGLTRRGRGVRVRADVPRTYYIGVELPMPAIPGMEPPIKALCVVPRGLEEGSEVELPGHELQLRVGQPVRFRFFTSTGRDADRPGSSVEDWEIPDALSEIAPLAVTLDADGQEEVVRVRLRAVVTETGVLELWCREASGERSWRLELDLRKQGEAADDAEEAPSAKRKAGAKGPKKGA